MRRCDLVISVSIFAIGKRQLPREQPIKIFSISVMAVSKAISGAVFPELLYL
jgi:hypothetical protein